MAGGPGYDIGASLANSLATSLDSINEDETYFIFGNSDNPSAGAGTSQTPTVTSTATATTAMPGGEATSTVPVAIGTPASEAEETSSGLSITTILLLAGAAILAIHFLHHHK